MINFIARTESPIPTKREFQSGDGQESADHFGTFQKEMTAQSKHEETKADPDLQDKSRSFETDKGSKAIGEKKEDTPSPQTKNFTPESGESSKDEVKNASNPENGDKPSQSPEKQSSETGVMNLMAALMSVNKTNSLMESDSLSVKGNPQPDALPTSVIPPDPTQTQEASSKKENPLETDLSQTLAPVFSIKEFEKALPGDPVPGEEMNTAQDNTVGDTGVKLSKGTATDEKVLEKIKNIKDSDEPVLNLKGDSNPEHIKLMSQDGEAKNEKVKAPVHKEGLASALIQGLQNDKSPEKKWDNPKEMPLVKDGLASISQGGEAHSAGSENFNSNSGRKEREDSSWETGDAKITQQSQPFKVGESLEAGNIILKTGTGKNHGPAFASNFLENRETSLQGFTIKNHDASSMAVTLEPEGLGKINIELKMNQDQIQGHIVVHEPTGKDLIESQLPNLLSDMTREGLQIGQFTVSLKQQGREQNPQQGFSGSADSKHPSIGTEEPGGITPISAGNNLIHIII
jgi:flagellar hook-length control protein FliK